MASEVYIESNDDMVITLKLELISGSILCMSFVPSVAFLSASLSFYHKNVKHDAAK